jgi:signal transduction histidine kinase/ligand-binding sensor domain-containing protein
MRIPLILFALALCSCCQAQNYSAHHHFNLLAVKDGMPEGTVKDLLQDKQGYLWIGTEKGIVRYDGYKPKVYDLGIKNPSGRDISKIIEDSEGQVAAAATDGLYMYDRVHDTFVPALHWLNGQFGDGIGGAAGNIWLGMRDSSMANFLMRFNPATKKSEIFSSKAKGKYQLNAENFLNLYTDKEQRLWVCSTNGLYEYDAKKNTFIPHLAHPDSSKRIATLFIQQDDKQPAIFYFFGFKTYSQTNLGFYRYDSRTDSLTFFHHDPKDAHSIANDTLTDIYADSKGRLWISTYSGLSLFNTSRQEFTNYFPKMVSPLKNFPIGIGEDKTGNLWISSSNGLYSFNINTKQFQRDTVQINFNNGLADNYTHNLFVDRSGVVWFGARQYGLQWIDTRRSEWIQYGNGPSADIFFEGGTVRSFTKAADGSIWIDTNKGLYRQVSSDSFRIIKNLPAMGKSIAVGTTNIVINGLIGIWNQARTVFYCYDPATGKTIDFPYKNLADTTIDAFNHISSLYKDHLGDIWIGTSVRGIWRYNSSNKTLTGFPFVYNNSTVTDTHGALDDAMVYSVYEDKEGVLWVGTAGGGLNRFNHDNGTFTSYMGKAPGFFSITNINEDSKGRLWVGTPLGGLFMLNKSRDSIKRFSEQDGLPYDGIWSTEEDDHGNIWAATPRGISIINPATGKIRNITSINNLTYRWGIRIIKTKNGNFYFSNYDGFIALNPDNFVSDSEPPVVHIRSMQVTKLVKDKPKDSTVYIDAVTSYKLHYDENRLTFTYVGLYYKDPSAIQYAYKLDGYDKDWVKAGTQRSVTYINLSPGTYVFHVKAANADGLWSKVDSITILISPPWWETWWFRILSVIAMIAVVYAIVQRHSRNLKKQNITLEEKVTQRTKELKHSLEELQSTQSQLIHSEKMASLGELTAGIAHEIQNPLNFVNNFSEVNREMLEELKAERLKPTTERDDNLQDDLINEITGNEAKINHHGKRADAIVKNMLQHSRQTKGVKGPADINALCDEYLRLAYHGLRAKDKSFNVEFKTDFDETIGKINIVPQEIGRVLLNLFNNAFYACNERSRMAVNEQKSNNLTSYAPVVSVSTKKMDSKVEIKVKDNGNGIPQNIIDKIFQPFFTTKPTGSGTGLGLSLSYDIIKAHGGEIKVESKEGEGTLFIILLSIA